MTDATVAANSPNARLLALFNHPQQPNQPAPPEHAANDEGADFRQVEGGAEVIDTSDMKPSVKKFLDYADKANDIFDQYPPFGLGELLAAPHAIVNQPRLRNGRYKDDTFARCRESATLVFGLEVAKKLCFRCKGTEVVCGGAASCAFGAEIFLATNSKPCCVSGCNLAVVPKVHTNLSFRNPLALTVCPLTLCR